MESIIAGGQSVPTCGRNAKAEGSENQRSSDKDLAVAHDDNHDVIARLTQNPLLSRRINSLICDRHQEQSQSKSPHGRQQVPLLRNDAQDRRGHRPYTQVKPQKLVLGPRDAITPIFQRPPGRTPLRPDDADVAPPADASRVDDELHSTNSASTDAIMCLVDQPYEGSAVVNTSTNAISTTDLAGQHS